MRTSYRIVIVGGGMTGLSVAALLSQSRYADSLAITVLDAAARPRWHENDDPALRVSALSIGSAEMLREVNAWPAIEAARVCPYERMLVWDENDEPAGPASLDFAAEEFAVPWLGYIVENKLVQCALLEQLARSKVDVRFETAIAAIDFGGDERRLTLESGESLQCDLIIGADGARSMVRKAANIEVRQKAYEQTALVTHLVPERPHCDTAWQRFLRSGPVGMLPLADGRISVVWSTTPEAAQEALACSDDELGERLTRVSDGVLGKLTVSGPRGAFPLAAQHAEDYVSRGVALIGDAAHTVHPLAGQGANLGLQDAEQLAAVIVAALDAGEHPADRPVLRRYERARKGANATMMHFMTGLNRLFASESSVLGELRRTGMQMFNRSGPLRERVVGVALGAGKR
jgi:2-octaprenylphenol hydroxylase